MATAFDETLRAIRRDTTYKTSFVLFLVIVFLGIWLAWALLARVKVFEVSPHARLEVSTATYAMTARSAGLVLRANLELGQRVKRGDILLELDDRAIQARRIELTTARELLPEQIAARRAELAAWEAVLLAREKLGRAELRSAGTRRETADTLENFANNERQELQAMVEKGIAPKHVLYEIDRELASLKGDKNATLRELSVLRSKSMLSLEETRAHIEGLRHGLIEIKSEEARLDAEIAQIKIDIEHMTLRAPIDGTIGELVTLGAGAWIEKGASLFTIVPQQSLRVVAQFAPNHAVGRVRTGQPARLRLDGFPWTQFGVLDAKVSRIAQPAQRSSLRVEFDLVDSEQIGVELAHGMTGTVEVEVERISPMLLLIRSAGLYLQNSNSNSSDENSTPQVSP